MIYLITVHDRLKRAASIDSPEQLETKVWKSLLNLTTHKTVLYTPDLFKVIGSKPLPNRVNILFAPRSKKSNQVPNLLINNNLKELTHIFSGKMQDVFVLCSNKTITELFAKDADFIIDYTTEELSCTTTSMFDIINFADYVLLRITEFENFVIRHFVREKTNFIGY